MNTGFLGSAVATVLTVYGIETRKRNVVLINRWLELQQYLPFTVLKLIFFTFKNLRHVATVLTVYGIETVLFWWMTRLDLLQQYLPFTVLKLKFLNLCISCNCCNSTYRLRYWNISTISCSSDKYSLSCNSTYRLRYWNIIMRCQTFNLALQQYLPFTVLKRIHN